MLILTRPWTRQPPLGVVQPPWLRVYHFGAQGVDAARGGKRFAPGTSAYRSSRAGTGMHVTAASQATTGEMLPGISSAITVVFIAEKLGATIASSNFLLAETATGAGAYNYGFYEGSSAGELAFYVHNGTSPGAAGGGTAWRAGAGPQVWVGTFGGGDNNVRMYLNGAQVSSAALTGSIRRDTSALLRCLFWLSGTQSFVVYAAAVAPTCIGAGDVATKFRDLPAAWNSLFAPRRIYIPTAAAAAGGSFQAAWARNRNTVIGSGVIR